MLDWFKKVHKKVTTPTVLDEMRDDMIRASLKPDDERRRVMADSMSTREELVAHRIWTDMRQRRIPFENLDDQRLINIWIYLHHRAYKKAMVAYFAAMGPLSDNRELYIAAGWAAYQKAGTLYNEPITRSILDEMVSRGIRDINEAISTDEEYDPANVWGPPQ